MIVMMYNNLLMWLNNTTNIVVFIWTSLLVAYVDLNCALMALDTAAFIVFFDGKLPLCLLKSVPLKD
jgi:energy-coupling factor transporter transmembrane protein EcfT